MMILGCQTTSRHSQAFMRYPVSASLFLRLCPWKFSCFCSFGFWHPVFEWITPNKLSLFVHALDCTGLYYSLACVLINILVSVHLGFGCLCLSESCKTSLYWYIHLASPFISESLKMFLFMFTWAVMSCLWVSLYLYMCLALPFFSLYPQQYSCFCSLVLWHPVFGWIISNKLSLFVMHLAPAFFSGPLIIFLFLLTSVVASWLWVNHSNQVVFICTFAWLHHSLVGPWWSSWFCSLELWYPETGWII